jgi:hypothetical protein
MRLRLCDVPRLFKVKDDMIERMQPVNKLCVLNTIACFRSFWHPTVTVVFAMN